MEQIVGKLQEWAVLYGLKVILAIVILALGRIIAGSVRSMLKKLLRKHKVEETVVSFVSSLAYVSLLTFVVVAALGKLGIQTTSFIAILGAAGLAIALSLQGSLSNFAAGVLMIILKPFKVGDYIEAGGTSGTVEIIGVFSTELKSPDNKKIIVPNSKAIGDNIINHTAKAQRRVDIVVGVSYSDDLDKVRKVLQQIIEEDNRFLKDPAPAIVVLALADSSINFGVRAWVNTADYWNTFFATQEKIKKRFDTEGITIPFQQQDIHIHKTE
ncbi:MAG: mechanosensitive ion channel [Proteobacteria bacterium]|nr:mechanosensitive ion channel [Pseudomonadota bacterium]